MTLRKPHGIEYSLIKASDPNICYIFCIYIPPGLHADFFVNFRLHAIEILDYLLGQTPEATVYVCGDLNRYDFSFLTYEFCLCNIVNVPTFRNACLDKFFCDQELTGSFSVTSAPPLGSAVNLHNIVIISRNGSKNQKNVCFHKVYDMRKSNIASFFKRISEIDWSVMSRFSHVDDCVNFFMNVLCQLCLPSRYPL